MTRNYSKETIESLIKKRDEKLHEDIEVVDIGGTALSLMGGRIYSKDIDLCYIKCDSPSEFAQAVVDSGKEIRIDPKDIEMFNGFEMSLLNIPQFADRAIPYEPLHLKHIKFKIMHPADMALSKIYRGEPRDVDDVKKLLDDGVIDVVELRSRFIQIIKSQDFDVRREFTKKYETFVDDYSKS